MAIRLSQVLLILSALMALPASGSALPEPFRPQGGPQGLLPQEGLPPQPPGAISRALVVLKRTAGPLQAYADLQQAVRDSEAKFQPEVAMARASQKTDAEFRRLSRALETGLRSGSPSRIRQLALIPGSNVVVYRGPMPWSMQVSLQAQGFEVLTDARTRLFLEKSTVQIGAKPAWNLKDAAGKPLRGTGVRIAVIDTGIDYTHPGLGGCTQQQFLERACAKVIDGYDFVGNRPDAMDDHGHGTHVSGIAAGTGMGLGGYPGVAPDAKLLAYKVMDSSGSGYTSDIISAVYRAMDPNQDGSPADHVDVINLSIGGPGNPDDPLSQAVDAAAQAGILVAVAAGNDGADQSVGSPGVARWALTVGAVDGQDHLASFSSRGPVVWKEKVLSKPDLVAPGVSICSTQGAGAWPQYACGVQGSRRVAISGTSMATPHVAGAAALLKQLRPGWSGLQLRSALIASALPLGGYGPAQVGAGRLNVMQALASRPTASPVIGLEPILGARQRQIAVQGTASGTRLTKFFLGVRPQGVRAYSTVVRRLIPGTPDTWKFQEQLDAEAYLDGSYEVRVEVTDAQGNTGVAEGFFRNRKLVWLEPAGLAVYRSGAPVGFESLPLLQGSGSVRYEVSRGIYTNSPTDRLNRVWTPVTGNQLQLPESETADQWYAVRATRMSGHVVDTQIRSIYFDARLRRGFPVRVPWECASSDPESACTADSGRTSPLVSDLNGDGKDEFLYVTPGLSPQLHVLGADGSSLWTRSIGSPMQTLVSLGPETHPVAVTRGPQGQVRIYAFNTRLSATSPDEFSEIHAFDAAGVQVEGFPLRVPRFYWPAVVTADLDQDGLEEIVVSSDFGLKGSASVYSWDGKLKANFEIPGHCWNKDGAPPAVAYFQGKALPPALVFAAHANCHGADQSVVAAFDSFGRAIPGWPRTVPGAITDSVVAGDLDGDGRDEVVATLQFDFGGMDGTPHLHAFRGDGTELPGFPALEGSSSIHGQNQSRPAVGDIDGDGRLEIAFSSSGSGSRAWQVFDASGRSVTGWPRAAQGLVAPPLMADLNGDRISELVLYETDLAPWMSSQFTSALMSRISGPQGVVKALPRLVPPNPLAQPRAFSASDGSGTQLMASSIWDASRDASGNTQTLRRSSIYVWDMVRAPGFILYSPQHLDLRGGGFSGSVAPGVTGGKPTSYSVLPPLPAGLHLDAQTGVLTAQDRPKSRARPSRTTEHWIFGQNEAGYASTRITVQWFP